MSSKSFCLALAFVIGTAPAVSAQAAPRTPDLIILLAVDQLRQDYLERFRPQFTGGLKRLLEEGAVFSNAFQDHAVTVTAVGHASMLSGRFPRSTGIISNVLGVPDPQARTLNGRGEGASPFRFRGSTVFDWLRVRDPLARALSVSVKDRGAILPLGRAKQSVFWYSSDGTFTTSNYYADTLPTWVRTFNAQELPKKYAGRVWEPLLPARFYPEPDTVAVEGGGRDVAFPHQVPSDVMRAIERLADFPWMDEILLQLALTGADSMKLGRSGHTDVLSISLSTTDLIGHAYGPDSREVHDQILRLDRALGVFFDLLFARFRPDQVVMALTADHGVSSFAGMHATGGAEHVDELHVSTTEILKPFKAFLDARNLPGSTIMLEAGMLRLNEVELGHNQALIDTIAAMFVKEVRHAPGIARVDYVRDLAKGDTVHDDIVRRWYQMIPPDVPVPVVATLKEGYVWGSGTSATHGSPYDADAHVPLVFFGPHFKPGRYSQFARTVDIAATLARVLKLEPTEPLDGKPLTQALR